MHYKIINNQKKEWILLIHSICANMHIFDDYINQLAYKYNIILVDLPGHGKSINVEVSNLDDVARRIVKILDENKIEKVDIWGISLGAIVANEIAYIFPKKVNLLLLEGAAFGFKNTFYKRMFCIFNKVNFLIFPTVYIHVFINLILKGKNRKKIIKKMAEYESTINKKNIKKWLKIMNIEYTTNIYNKIKLNSKRIYLMGEKDKIFIDSIRKNVVDNQNTKLVILKDKSHLCHLDEIIDILEVINVLNKN